MQRIVRLEIQTEAGRTLAETERMEREKQKLADATNISFAVDALAKGLECLANGKVGYRINTPFVSALDGLRVNLNSSLEKLHVVLRSVGQNAAGIDTGANEIRSAADDLQNTDVKRSYESASESSFASEFVCRTVSITGTENEALVSSYPFKSHISLFVAVTWRGFSMNLY